MVFGPCNTTVFRKIESVEIFLGKLWGFSNFNMLDISKCGVVSFTNFDCFNNLRLLELFSQVTDGDFSSSSQLIGFEDSSIVELCARSVLFQLFKVLYIYFFNHRTVRFTRRGGIVTKNIIILKWDSLFSRIIKYFRIFLYFYLINLPGIFWI